MAEANGSSAPVMVRFASASLSSFEEGGMLTDVKAVEVDHVDGVGDCLKFPVYCVELVFAAAIRVVIPGSADVSTGSGTKYSARGQS